MAPNRHLPERHNPLLLEDVPPHSELVARRRLGQTQLTARMVAGVPAGDIHPSALGAFDYAHLRAPLPKGIVSGIFKSSPPSYFLMRRSEDGYVSATGMFKATFPYATQEEEEAERKYIKSLPSTSPEETAGNVWIPPEQALILAEEYQILPWIRALLDPADIATTTGADSGPPKKITAPPKFFSGQPTLAPPTPSTSRTSRSRRSASPAKSTASKRAIASPRKRRGASSQPSVVTDSLPSSTGDSVSPTLVNGETPNQSQLSTASTSKVAKVEEAPEAELKIESIEKEPAVVLEPVEEGPKVKIHLDQDVKVDKEGDEVKHTKVELEVPLFGELPSPEDAAKMVADAKAMVEAAVKADNEASGASSSKGKRKADDIAQDEDGEGKEEGGAEPPKSKKVKTEAELRKEKIRKRAYFGLTATVAVGAIGALVPILTPYVMNAL
ncbi:hypothetical protein MYCTH_2135627 [Thermothelomyces thermophilus ATCC 42464]|uniref:HTH APSES-type domain-containing protein n=1 Tax=Thermothelomyces thermophilus (strain ATCC 42464 / BCRC 31852 / DSM 1799) TaxID=573729 RepID=G2QLK7_THET4|nr:uncharacterized protein MYCTH_2135627 [Thermothelomyces thermophilus ATCC 42464]AEO60837.1 hypothetical protein MYCTH_2135627 [Thermothelomyces thermophilus ATCC 42464]